MSKHRLADPLGNEIHFNDTICGSNGASMKTEEILDSATEVIAKPTLMFRLPNSYVSQYYFRAVGWDTTILIGVAKIDGHFEAVQCIKNPSHQLIHDLMNKGEQII